MLIVWKKSVAAPGTRTRVSFALGVSVGHSTNWAIPAPLWVVKICNTDQRGQGTVSFAQWTLHFIHCVHAMNPSFDSFGFCHEPFTLFIVFTPWTFTSLILLTSWTLHFINCVYAMNASLCSLCSWHESFALFIVFTPWILHFIHCVHVHELCILFIAFTPSTLKFTGLNKHFFKYKIKI